MNYLRYYRLFTQNLTGERLPPTLDSLLLHLQRANYHCYAWKSVCTPILKLPAPVRNGWVKSGEILDQGKPVQNAVSKALNELVRCKCKKRRKTNTCGCKKEGLRVLMRVYVTRRKNAKTKNAYYCYDSSDDKE